MIHQIVNWLCRPTSQWKIIDELGVFNKYDRRQIGVIYVLQDQYGNIKYKQVTS